MARAFVFCIGGTGERVMKSITMLMAAGMSTSGYDIVPIIVDHHDDLNEKINLNTLIEEYRSIYRNITLLNNIDLGEPKGFFSSKMENIDDLKAQRNSKQQSTGQSFGDYINKRTLTKNINNYLVQTLYSTANLNDSLKVGFRGSPNVGTVVLNDQMRNSDWYDAVIRNFKSNDCIFIISSIFGGTGASGFPLLEKIIRNQNDNLALKDANMGALTVMPYYGLGDPSISGSRIDSADFMTKAKSALTYYEDNILSNKLYYVGETALRSIYTNDEKAQQNAANFTELVGATAFFHFLQQPVPSQNDEKLYYTRAIKDDKSSLNLTSLGDGYAPLVKTVVDFLILGHLVDILPEEDYFPLSQSHGFDEDFYNDDFKRLANFCNNDEYGFKRWYEELATNDRAFAVYSMIDGDDMANCVPGKVLDADDDSYYLLSMIENANYDTDNLLRNFLVTCYDAITEYTYKITETIK